MCKEGSSLLQRRQKLQTEDGFYAPTMYPPGRLVHLQHREQEHICCGAYRVDSSFYAEWVTPDMLGDIVLSLKAVEQHFPNLIEWALEDAMTDLCMDESSYSASSYSDEEVADST